MLQGIFIIIMAGFLGGEMASKLGLPKLIGMLLMGILIGPYVLDVIPEVILLLSYEIRMLALLIILFKAGLGLDKEKLLAQGTVAIRLGFLPAIIEASVVAFSTRMILGWDWLLCWLLGWIICAASPAVIVPMMLRLKAEGYGVKKGIPDLILAGGTASDATAVTLFGIFLVWITGDSTGNLLSQLTDIPLQIIIGVILGYIAGRVSHYLIQYTSLTENIVHCLFITLGLALFLVLGENLLPYSPFLAVMVMGFTLLERDAVVSRRLRKEIDKVWVLGEIFLFVLIGAAVNTSVIIEASWTGFAIIMIGLAIGRWLGIFASTFGSIMTIKERLFMVIGDMAKATVQAAIGGIPLSMGVPHGEYILAISVLSILITAPLGAFGTAFLAPRLLEKGQIDPTKITVEEEYRILVALDGLETSKMALEKASRIARQLDGRLIILHIPWRGKELSQAIIQEMLHLASDIEYDIMIKKGDPSFMIVEEARRWGADMIFMGKSNECLERGNRLGDIATRVIEDSVVPVLFVTERDEMSATQWSQ